MPEAAPVIRAVDPALKTGCKGMIECELHLDRFTELGLVGKLGKAVEWNDLI